MPKPTPKAKKWFPNEYMAVIKFREARLWDDRGYDPAPRFDTWAEAHQWKLGQARQKVEYAKTTLASAERNLKKVQAMKPLAEGGKA